MAGREADTTLSGLVAGENCGWDLVSNIHCCLTLKFILNSNLFGSEEATSKFIKRTRHVTNSKTNEFINLPG